MKFMEIIRVQAAAGREKCLKEQISTLNNEVRKGPEIKGLLECLDLQQALVPGSFAIHLSWEMETPSTLGSPLGLNLIEALKGLGLINHSIWINRI